MGKEKDKIRFRDLSWWLKFIIIFSFVISVFSWAYGWAS